MAAAAWHRVYDAMVNEKMTPWGMTRCLSVRRRSGRDRIGWDALPDIKHDLLGPDGRAVEVYPAAADCAHEMIRMLSDDTWLHKAPVIQY